MDKEVLAIIPARAGSERIPRKNLKLLDGKPLIEYAFQAALDSKLVTRTMLLTDDTEAHLLSTAYKGIETLTEPEVLAKGDVPAIEYIGYVINKLSRHGYVPEAITVLQPTTPLRTGEHIDEGLKLLFETNADSVVGVKSISEPPEWMYRVGEQSRLEKFIESDAQNSQQAKKLHILNGAFYGFTPDSFKKFDRYLFGGDIRGYEMDAESSVDIDEEVDFLIAESIFQSKMDPIKP